MTLNDLKSKLQTLEAVSFQLPNGEFVPKHFHVTEVGIIDKKFIDCGGKVREEKVINFQLWYADDHDHRLSAQKLLNIVELSERVLGIENLSIEVEYQSDTIGKYGLSFDGRHFVLETKQTDCLARDKCGMPTQKPKVEVHELAIANSPSCSPNSGCC
ncbi:MAG: DUF6428 family protein [Bacteroidota bacterium]